MPAKSKAQQKMFGIAHAIQQGKIPASKARGPATDVAKAAKPKDVKDFASTKTKNLPTKVKKEQVERIREYVTKVVREVLAEAKSDEVAISQGQDGDWWVNGPGGYQDGPFKDRGKAWGAMVYYKKRGITSQGVNTNLKEAAGKKWYLAWYDTSKKKWFEKVFTKERDANKELDVVGDRLRAAGDKHPNISYGTDNSIYG